MIALISYSALSFLLVGLYRQLALRYHWLDSPNQRSSHTLMTPRGAGIIFALLIIASAYLSNYPSNFFPPLLMGLAVALTGWWDDIRGASPQWRLFLYAIFSGIAAVLIFGFPYVTPAPNLINALLYGLLATLGLTWLINLYNFMDGINGLAALEAIFVLIAIDLLSRDTAYGQTFSPLHYFSCAAVIGFLLWNFPAGKIFMGDAGSAFLGFFLGVLMIFSYQLSGPKLTVWLILLAVFITDTTFTLCMRIATNQQWHEAHRLHAYQRLTSYLQGNHTRCTSLLMLINICWLLPVAWLAQTGVINQFIGLILAYLPLTWVCSRLKAGIPHQGEV